MLITNFLYIYNYIFCRVLKSKLKTQLEQWSGEATRSGGFAVEEARVDVNIVNNDSVDNTIAKKDRPVWMSESTVLSKDSEKVTFI